MAYKCAYLRLFSFWVLPLFFCAVHCAAEATKQAQFFDKSTDFAFAIASSVDGLNETVLSFQISAPDKYGYAAIGTGDSMRNSLMFVVYASGDVSNPITLSPRTATGHEVPHPINNVNSTILSSSHTDGKLNISFQLSNPQLRPHYNDVNSLSQSQPWIWAVGPEGSSINSANQNIAIQKHSQYGTIFVDMTETSNANPSSQVIPAINGTSNIFVKPQPSSYHTLVIIHAVLLGASFVIVFPLGAILLRFQWNNPSFNFKIHWMLQASATAASYIGLILAIWMSTISVEYSNFSRSHQVIGIIVVSLLSVQAFMGYLHHTRFKKFAARTWISYLHIFGGRIVIHLGMVNAVLGFLLSSSLVGAIAVAVVSVLFIIALTVLARRNQRFRNRSTLNSEGKVIHASGDQSVVMDYIR